MTKATNTRLLKPIYLVAIIFFTVSGGPYGLEPLLQFAGKNGALLLILVVPILWDLPAVLTVLELNSMMPANGGYYLWINRALGRRWAFYESWWSALYSFTDLAIYPVLFVTYLSFFFPEIATYKIPICLAIIWACSGLNILGIIPIGDITLVLGAIVIIPFIILFGSFFFNHPVHQQPLFSGGIKFTSLGLALYTYMWNVSGWDNTTTYAGEVDKPVRSYSMAMGITFVAVIVFYLLTVWVSANYTTDYANLSDNGYPILGLNVGWWLGALLSLGGMASTVGIFTSLILSISRVPKVMADDKLLPAKFSVLHKKFNTPYLSILVCASLVSFMILWKFTDLLVIDIILYGAGILLEFISLIVLRLNEPDAPRPFKIRLGVVPLSVLVACPMIVYVVALATVLHEPGNTFIAAVFGIGALLSAELVWQVVKRLPFAKKG